MRAFLIVFVLAGIAASAALVTLAAEVSGETVPALFLSGAALWIAWLAMVVAALLVLVWILRRAGRHLAPVFGDNAVARWLALGLIGLLFSDTVRNALYPLVRFVVDLANTAPDSLTAAKAMPQTGLEATSGSAIPSFDAFMLLITVPLQNLGHNLARIDLPWAFVALAAWAVAGQFLSTAMRTDGSDSPNAWSRLLETLHRAPGATWQNVLLFAVITMGGLLSVSALITLPLLSQSNPLSAEELKRFEADLDAIARIDEKSPIALSELTLPDALRKELDALTERIRRERGRQEKRLPEPDATLPAAASIASTATAGISAPAADAAPVAPSTLRTMQPPTPVDALDYLNQIEQRKEQIVQSARSSWSEYQPTLKQSIDSARMNALFAIKRQNFAPGGTRSEYVAEVSSWLGDTVSATKLSAAYCQAALVRSIQSYLEFAAFDMRALESDLPITGAPGYPVLRPFECAQSFAVRDQPAEHQLALGAFGFSEWLIRLNSLPLTLIAGMLGFGLVGAAVSSVVRERKEREAGKPLVSDITGVLVRGLSATIVVYLAVKGGLVIFTAGSAGEPDPHVLLLTCLVASVFSEDVWAAAKDRLVKKIRGEEGGTEDGSSLEGSQQAPASGESTADAGAAKPATP